MGKADNLKSYVPEFISQNAHFQAIYDTQGTEMDSLYTAIEDILNQCFVDTATWGLEFWEKFLRIPVDGSKPYEHRRSVVRSKMRGVGTITVSLIQSVAESYANGEVDVIESPGAYSFTVKFIGEKGIPPNLSDLQAAISEIKPAHLAVNYEFTYNTYDYVAQFTHSQLSVHTHEDIRGVI